ncbi:MAG: CRISPR-associated helicase Cas3' [Deinococcota bacterium]
MEPHDPSLKATHEKALRLIRLLELLKLKPWTAQQLAQALGIKKRAVLYYLQDLQELGSHLGFRLIHDEIRRTYSLNAGVVLSDIEKVVIHTALRMLYYHSPGHNQQYQEALLKLARGLPEPARSVAQKSVEAMAARGPGLEGSNLEKITNAWFRRQLVQFHYQLPGRRELTKFELETYFIEVSRANMAVYVIGRERSYKGQLRTFKLARMQFVTLVGPTEAYEIPASFDPREYLSDAWGIVGGRGDPVRVRLRFSPQAVPRIREGGYPNLQELEEGDDGSLVVEVAVGADEDGFPIELLSWVQSWGPRVEVLEPEFFRQRWLEEAVAVAELYSSDRNLGSTAYGSYWAHTPRKDDPRQRWQPLREHLEAVAHLARDFAAQFNVPAASELAYWLGILHDLGKYSQEFQDYLRAAYRADRFGSPPPAGRVDHSSAGAVLGRDLLLAGYEDDLIPANGFGSELAWAVAYHHGRIGDRSLLTDRLLRRRESPEVQQALDRACEELKDIFGGVAPEVAELEPLAREFFIRMLLSALVDADRLDTERFWSPRRYAYRTAPKANLQELLARVKEGQEKIRSADTLVNRARWEIYQAALEAAALEPGFFRLTVPTGGGKTRSSLAFALEHAVKFGLRRVVYAVPYTSIIDQTAEEFAKLLGAENVLEHHSAYEPADAEEESRARLASENWDMPVVVTTTVQLFESLLSNNPSKLRKIHNLAGSVIVLDEVQTLPANLLQPTLDVLKELVRRYRVSVVLCTATQPALDAPLGFAALEGVREIVRDPGHYFRQLKRVTYRLELQPQPWEAVAERLRGHDQVLCIVNTKQQARDLYAALDDPEAVHLSTHMYPAHRREVLAAIRDRLKHNLPCRVVSTQLVEAGVDLDFPMIYRALGPLDSVVQAAGRCNREGRLERGGQPVLGEVTVFRPEREGLPQGVYASATGLARNLLRQGADLDDPELFTQYFTELYRDLTHTDAKEVQSFRQQFNYPKVAELYRLIGDNTFPVLVRKRAQDAAAIDRILSQHTGFMALRKLQPYIVNIYTSNKEKLAPFIREMTELDVELWEWTGNYSEKLGIEELFDADDSVV